jgi:hypothetical protein
MRKRRSLSGTVGGHGKKTRSLSDVNEKVWTPAYRVLGDNICTDTDIEERHFSWVEVECR